MHTSLQNILISYGFSKREAKVYLAVLEMGNTGVSAIARRSGVNRATVYTILNELMKKGYAQEIVTNSIKHYSVIRPEELFQQKQKDYHTFKEMLPEFIMLQDTYGKKPHLQTFSGKHSVEKMLYDYCNAWSKSAGEYDNTWRGFQDHLFVDEYRNWLESYRSRKNKVKKIYLLSNPSNTEEELGERLTKSHNRVMKNTPHGFSFTNTIRVVGDYIIMINIEKTHQAFQIHDQTFAANLREIFKMLWQFV